MVTVHQTALALLILQIYVSAAPTDAPKQENTLEVANEELRLDSLPSSSENNKNHASHHNSTQRQKRFYNHYGFPPLPYPSYNKRDQASDLGVYGLAEDPLIHIQRRLQEIASVVRQPAPPPPPPVTPHIPLFFPVIFVPQFGCACNPDTATQPPPTPRPQPTPTPKPQPTNPATKPPVDGGTSPDIVNRFPEMDDERQNWGLVFDETEEDDDGEDFSRPISFEPIELNTSTSRPAPPVEHGSNQAGAQDGAATTTTIRPIPPSNDSPPLASAAAAAPYPPNSPEAPKESPSTCDGAVLSCCHQPQVTYDCFAVLGCPDPTSYGNPCDPLVILRVIGKFQKYYGVRTG